ncbi:MAG: DUF4440 domain-containing protein [Cryomorphaceae bacterium]|nr:DUF4440 domain-containing protein [Cryomorphaceae bacterium]
MTKIGVVCILITACSLLFSACTPDVEQINPIEAVETAMQQQEIDWNNGNIEGFMSSYWNNEDLIFIGRRGLSKGWQTTLDNYKKSYPDKEQMGRLMFQNDTLIQMGAEVVFVAGRWSLFRKADTLAGAYSLTWELKNRNWVITTDHSS